MAGEETKTCVTCHEHERNSAEHRRNVRRRNDRVRTMTDCGSWRVMAEEQRRAEVVSVLEDLWQQVLPPG